MTKNLARLRVLAAENGDTGSAEARDTSIQAFLDELEGVVCRQVVDLLPDSNLRALYVGWTSQLLAGLDTESRKVWFSEGVIIAPAPQGRHIEHLSAQGNVVKLHARH